jgi:glycosyltransferase involved in cell wall biosynthesis
MLLSNFPGTGIGAFGAELHRAMEELGTPIRFESTATHWREFFGQCWRVFRVQSPVLANVGLTSWGRSRLRNLLGLWVLGLRANRGRPTTILLHNLIELVDPGDAGYRLGAVARYFAHRAVASLRSATFVVFSQELAQVLRDVYGIEPARAGALPCPVTNSPGPQAGDLPLALYFGYLSPYKGVDYFLTAVEGLSGKMRSVVVGGPHSLLGSDPAYQKYLDELRSHARRAGTDLAGFLPEPELTRLLRGAFVGVLPYTSTTGASASYTQLAAAGIPVIASDLPEFRTLQRDGAGIVLVHPDGKAIRSALERLLEDSELWSRLSREQFEYARRHPWSDLAQWMVENSLRSSFQADSAPS